MSKVTKNTSLTNPIIELWDTDRVGSDAVFHYVTPEMTPEQDARRFNVSSNELEDFIEENGMNEFQTDVDRFSSYDAHDYLMDNWEEVAERFWLEIAQPKLEINYKEALAYMQSYIKKAGHPLSSDEYANMSKSVVSQFGIYFGKEAA